MGLGAWVALCLLRTFGFPPVVRLMAGIPGIRLTAFYRYANPTWELAAILLAALGLDDVARGNCRRLVLVASVLVTAALAAWAAVTAWPLLTAASSTGPMATTANTRHPYIVGSLAGALVLLAVLAAGGMVAGRRNQPASGADGTGVPVPASRVSKQERAARRRRRGRALMAAVVCVESVLLLGFTYLSAPTRSTFNGGAVGWLQGHLGTSRYYTLGPIQPNYGSYFGIAEANVNDLPLPKSWSDYVSAHLDPNAPKVLFTGVSRNTPSGPTPAQELTRHLADYESIGVRFVVESANGLDVQGKPFPAIGSRRWPAGPRLVYHDAFDRDLGTAECRPPVLARYGVTAPEGRGRVRGDLEDRRPGRHLLPPGIHPGAARAVPTGLDGNHRTPVGHQRQPGGGGAGPSRTLPARRVCSRRWTCRPAPPPSASPTCPPTRTRPWWRRWWPWWSCSARWWSERPGGDAVPLRTRDPLVYSPPIVTRTWAHRLFHRRLAR